MKYQKVLVISHNVFSKTSSMRKTLSNFFSKWPCDKLAQLYFHTEIPTTSICHKYFRITDFDLLNLNRTSIGNILGEKDININLKSERVDEGAKSIVYQYGRKRKPYMYFFRNLLWNSKRWHTSKLDEWINAFDPDIIFFASGDYIFSYKIVQYIAKSKKIPILTYVCDDYYFLKKRNSLFNCINTWLYRKTLKQLLNHNKYIVSICNEITRDYVKEFEVNATTIMTSSDMKEFRKISDKKIVLSYIGNLGYNRNLALLEIGQALKKISNNELYIDVYSTECRQRILADLTEENGIHFRGCLHSDGVLKTMENSDVLIHIESMDKVNREKVKYSVSTKIADSLASGRCLFAYGPEEVASIQHLIRNDCAFVVTKREDLEQNLHELIQDDKNREYYIKNALKTAHIFHDLDNNCTKIKNIIDEVIDGNESFTG